MGDELDELGIQLGLLQLLKALEFLHNNLIVHVYITMTSELLASRLYIYWNREELEARWIHICKDIK
jgi:hypothetical protein